MHMMHLTDKHNEIPPGLPTQFAPNDKQCPFCKLWWVGFFGCGYENSYSKWFRRSRSYDLQLKHYPSPFSLYAPPLSSAPLTPYHSSPMTTTYDSVLFIFRFKAGIFDKYHVNDCLNETNRREWSACAVNASSVIYSTTDLLFLSGRDFVIVSR